MDDESIIGLYFLRDEEAIRQTDTAYGRRLLALASRILLDPQDAEEAVNDTYLKAWESIPPQKPRFFYAYLAQICRYLAMNKLDWKTAEKRNAQVVSLSDEMELCIPDNRKDPQREGQELSVLLDQFLEEITPESRVIFMRRYWFGDSIQEIAQHCRISQSKVKMRLLRARKQLAEFLDKEGIAP